MKFRISFFIYLISFVGVFSCIDPVNFDNQKTTNVLVVEGSVSTLPGPHFVKLTRTARYGDVFDGINGPVLDANIYVRDDLGNVTVYAEVGKGTYKSPADFSGVVGRSYSIFIETREGNEYLSIAETITEVPEIDSVFYEFKTLASISKEGKPITKTGVDIKIITNDPGNSENYYKWNTKGTFKFKSNPELYTPPRATSPRPKDCCDICWLSEDNIELNITNDKLFQGNQLVQSIFFIEDNGSRFYEKYYLEVEQKSISQSSFKFYTLLKNQLDINGDIFDSPPTEITGNIISLTDPNEAVIGHFSAFDISTTNLFVIGTDLPLRTAPPKINDDCRVVRNATTQKPSFWEE